MTAARGWGVAAFLVGVPVALGAHPVVPSIQAVGWEYGGLGWDHLWTGWDHLAFLVGLLLPGGRLLRIVEVVTGFTLAHTLTLFLAATETIVPLGDLVEPLIALTVLIVALDAGRPISLGRRPVDRRFGWALTFGLIHGVAFAGALSDYGLPAGRVVEALLAFNLGLEGAQLVLVVLALPVVTAVHRLPDRYRRPLIRAASWGLAFAGAMWFVLRVEALAFGWRLS